MTGPIEAAGGGGGGSPSGEHAAHLKGDPSSRPRLQLSEAVTLNVAESPAAEAAHRNNSLRTQLACCQKEARLVIRRALAGYWYSMEVCVPRYAVPETDTG